ncbi:hypothetical protein [Pseudotabrizicola algicola]|uniref:Uncharacterized protein n=1 Tax=Pseudotabrizicola algicola TaxID=2709381 RepID=A0A6B3RNE9_9RHOB|nr:hypothetical protein [Pseudotabrizicola algicola]NEX47624.1 hypothetical protein [Pseudotabrizicola algicola]
MSARLQPDLPLHQRIAIIEAALERALDRGPEMSVEAHGPNASDLSVYVIARPFDDARVAHDLHDIARELEVLL